VFHCTAGKDRTGMVAALVLSLVGVDDAVIIEDYILTDDRMTLVMERIRAGGDFPEPLAPVSERIARAEASSMQTFLDALSRTQGGAEGWARAAGLRDEVGDTLRELLVETPRR
jgi:protein tyrosine/serine phosphatase